MIERSSGILMPISSLPSPHGIGTMGKAAYDFADFLAAAGQKYWQLLPLGPTSYGDSPYQSFSSFAGNPYFIDLDLLVKDKLLTRAEVNACDWGDDPRYVDYGKIYASRFTLLEKAKARGFTRDREAVAAFERENERWLPNYALFMALKRHFGMKSWTEWGAFNLHSVSLLPPVGGTQGVHPLARHPHHRRSAHLCGDGLCRRVGRTRNVPARRAQHAHRGLRRPA